MSALKLLVVKFGQILHRWWWKGFKRLQKKTKTSFLHHSNVLFNQSNNCSPTAGNRFGVSLSGGNISLAFKVSSNVCCFSTVSFKNELAELVFNLGFGLQMSKLHAVFVITELLSFLCSNTTEMLAGLGWTAVRFSDTSLGTDLAPMIETGSRHSCCLSNEQNQNGKAVVSKQNLS